MIYEVKCQKRTTFHATLRRAQEAVRMYGGEIRKVSFRTVTRGSRTDNNTGRGQVNLPTAT